MSLLGKLTGLDQARHIALGIAVAALVLAPLAWGAAAHLEARAIAGQAELLCAASGQPFAAPRKADRGKACLARIRALAAFHTATLAASNTALADAAGEQALKTRNDTARAVANAARREAAVQQMETRDDQVQDDHVDGDWFADLNRLGGLRPPAR